MFRAIVVGTDGSETAGEAVRAAIDLARRDGATLHLVSAFLAAPQARLRAGAPQAPRDAEWHVDPREDVDATLAEAHARTAGAGIDVRAHAREGDAADAILDVAEETGADLIVVGNKGMTGAKRFLLGTVPNRVSHHAPCSVLIVRTG
jgi:nucleotide-binding universal stress UspA family protein